MDRPATDAPLRFGSFELQRHERRLLVDGRAATLGARAFDVLAAEGVPAHTGVHCVTGGPAEARRCLDLGAMVSFSGIVTFKTAMSVRLPESDSV